MFDCRIKKNEFPKEGDLVITKPILNKDGIIIMSLLEYGGIEGMVFEIELSKKKIRSLHQLVKLGIVDVCQVLSVDKEKNHIDLSLKKVDEAERSEMMNEFAKNKISYQIFVKLSKLIKKPIGSIYEEIVYPIYEKSHSPYEYLMEIRDKNPEDLNGDTERNLKFLAEEHFKSSTIRVRVDVDVSCPSGGVNSVKTAFRNSVDQNVDLEITLIKPPTYSITLVGKDREKNRMLEVISNVSKRLEEEVLKLSGNFSIVTSPAVYGQKKSSVFEKSTIK